MPILDYPRKNATLPPWSVRDGFAPPAWLHEPTSDAEPEMPRKKAKTPAPSTRTYTTEWQNATPQTPRSRPAWLRSESTPPRPKTPAAKTKIELIIKERERLARQIKHERENLARLLGEEERLAKELRLEQERLLAQHAEQKTAAEDLRRWEYLADEWERRIREESTNEEWEMRAWELHRREEQRKQEDERLQAQWKDWERRRRHEERRREEEIRFREAQEDERRRMEDERRREREYRERQRREREQRSLDEDLRRLEEDRLAREAREREYRLKEEEEERKEHERTRRERERIERLVLEGWNSYEARWAAMQNAPPTTKFTFRTIGWPVLYPPTSPAGLTSELIEAFLLSPMHSPNKPRKLRLRDALLRFHPDKFNGKWLPRVEDSHKEAVKEGVAIVSRCLNSLLALDP